MPAVAGDTWRSLQVARAHCRCAICSRSLRDRSNSCLWVRHRFYGHLMASTHRSRCSQPCYTYKTRLWRPSSQSVARMASGNAVQRLDPNVDLVLRAVSDTSEAELWRTGSRGHSDRTVLLCGRVVAFDSQANCSDTICAAQLLTWRSGARSLLWAMLTRWLSNIVNARG